MILSVEKRKRDWIICHVPEPPVAELPAVAAAHRVYEPVAGQEHSVLFAARRGDDARAGGTGQARGRLREGGRGEMERSTIRVRINFI
jgi:hypothetical protein